MSIIKFGFYFFDAVLRFYGTCCIAFLVFVALIIQGIMLFPDDAFMIERTLVGQFFWHTFTFTMSLQGFVIFGFFYIGIPEALRLKGAWNKAHAILKIPFTVSSSYNTEYKSAFKNSLCGFHISIIENFFFFLYPFFGILIASVMTQISTEDIFFYRVTNVSIASCTILLLCLCHFFFRFKEVITSAVMKNQFISLISLHCTTGAVILTLAFLPVRCLHLAHEINLLGIVLGSLVIFIYSFSMPASLLVVIFSLIAYFCEHR